MSTVNCPQNPPSPRLAEPVEDVGFPLLWDENESPAQAWSTPEGITSSAFGVLLPKVEDLAPGGCSLGRAPDLQGKCWVNNPHFTLPAPLLFPSPDKPQNFLLSSKLWPGCHS